MISMNRLSQNDSPGYFMADIGVAIGQGVAHIWAKL